MPWRYHGEDHKKCLEEATKDVFKKKKKPKGLDTMETCTHRKTISAEKYQGRVASMTKKGYYGGRTATLKAWKRSVKTMSLWCMICKFLCIQGIQKGWVMGQFSDFRASSEETEPKIGIYAIH